MADTKITALTADTTPDGADLVVTVDDVSGTPTNKKVTISNLSKGVNATNITTGTLPVGTGGTGQTSYTDGQILIGNTTGNTLAKATLTEGDGIDIANGGGTITITAETATDSNSGISELAIASEVNTGTDTGRTITPDALAGSNLGTKVLEVTAFDYATAVAAGDGAGYVTVPSSYAGMNLVAAHARVITAGTTNTTDIQIHNLTQTADMLSTKVTIDSTETGSNTAATAAVIDTANDDVAAWDVLRVDVDAVSTTAPQGLIVTLEFRLP